MHNDCVTSKPIQCYLSMLKLLEEVRQRSRGLQLSLIEFGNVTHTNPLCLPFLALPTSTLFGLVSLNCLNLVGVEGTKRSFIDPAVLPPTYVQDIHSGTRGGLPNRSCHWLVGLIWLQTNGSHATEKPGNRNAENRAANKETPYNQKQIKRR